MSEQSIILPEILAAKMAAVGNFKAPEVSEQLKAQPRLFELLWFLQAMSMRPGGLAKFVEEFLAEFSLRIGTATMHSAPKGKTAYSKRQRDGIISEIPNNTWWHLLEKQPWVGDNFWNEVEYKDFLETVREDGERERQRKEFLATINFDCFHKLCQDEASDSLAGYLARVCNEAETPLQDPWYFPGLMDALLEMLDSHAARTSASLAMTEVSLKIFDAMDYAWQEKALVHIEGDSRFGKTQSVKTWCAAWPGKARYFAVPCSNSDADLIKAIATALGMEFSFKTPCRQLKARVEYVINFSGLMFVADEAHWLLPTRFSANTPPMRLNWLRTEIVDRNCAVVTVSTPQDYKKCVEKFTRATGHNITQFLGRTMLNVPLPNELEQDDLLAVARIHFPQLEDDFLQVIVGTAMRSESYLMAVEAIAKRVRFIARRDNHPSVTLADLKLAISEIIPGQAAPAPAAPARSAPPQRANPIAIKRSRATKATAPALQMPPGRSVTAAAPPDALEAPARSRSMTPATLQPV